MQDSQHATADTPVNMAPIVTNGGARDLSTAFGSNAVRLRLWEWGLVAVLIGAFVGLAPRWWKHAIPFDVPGDYRVPYRLNNDYWTYNRWLETAAKPSAAIFLVGDSVVWGEYVAPHDTLNQCLNREDRSHRFVNAGLNGTHPLALEGLVRNYAGALRGRHVIMHCNLLWMSSPERDLQIDKETDFNHPDLIPQLLPWIPPYRANGDQRLGIIIDRMFAFRGLVNHVRIAYFDRQDLQNWSIEHPYDNPFHQIRMSVECPAPQPHSPPVAWTDRGMTRQDLPWVTPESSLQWQAMTRTITLLRRRHNHVFVIVGPFNEHLLTASSRRRFVVLHAHVIAWLQRNSIPYYAPAPLDSKLYGDASHPLAVGYRQLAHAVYQDKTFQHWLR